MLTSSRAGQPEGLVERLVHDLLELGVDDRLAPVVAVEVLDPLEVADGHAAGVAQDVRDEEDAPVVEDRVGLRRGRAVGGLATIDGLDVAAFWTVIWFSRAAGMRMSQSISRTSAFVTSAAPGKPWTVPCSFFQAMTRSMSRPAGLWIPPVESLTATTVAPSLRMRRAAIEPALPKPWTATVAP